MTSMSATDMTAVQSTLDFGKVHSTLQSYVDRDLLSGVSSAILKGQDLVDIFTTGYADIEGGIEINRDHLFRIFSNTKLVTTTAIMMLFEDGKIELDDPIEKWIPQLGNRKVLKPGATDASDVEDAERPISIRHLLSHSSGLTYGLFDPGSVAYTLYQDAGVNDPSTPLSVMMDTLEALPLVFQPGTSWEYSVATDVLGHLVEIISGKSLDEFFAARIFDPLGMVDTGFHRPESDRPRLAKIYLGASMEEPMKTGLTESPGLMSFDHFAPPIRPSGGGGLVSTLPDMVALIRSYMPGGRDLLKRETIDMMMTNQLAKDVNVQFPMFGAVSGVTFGLGGALKEQPAPGEPESAIGEFQWGGVAGTHWWINPQTNIAALTMTQREMAFWHPFSADFKREVYAAMAE